VDNRQKATDVEAKNTIRKTRRMTAQQAMMRLSNRPTRAQLVEMETQEKDNNETVHEGSQMAENISPCMAAAVSPNSRRALLLVSATDMTIPAPI